MKRIYILLLITIVSIPTFSQNKYIYPLNVKATLSANFGELRGNHFHSGLDLKTDGVVNKPVTSVADGYVSRISISAWGYGLALYIDHPNGQTSVYGHLNKYADKINKHVKAKQYAQEKYMIDLQLEPNEIIVKKGEVVAYSGNTGGSFGPHVHFELRESSSQRVYDPLTYYKGKLEDTESPVIRGLAIYPQSEKGVVNQSSKISRYTINKLKDGSHSPITRQINAWGKIGLGIYAVDKMNGTHNVYGVKHVKLYCDNKLIFHSNIESFLFDETRMINSLTDFNHWKQSKNFYMKSFVEPGNKLPIYETLKNNGYINIDKEKTYALRYELEDAYGNATIYNLNIVGKKQDIPQPNECTQYMVWKRSNFFTMEDFILYIPQKCLYTDIPFTLVKKENDIYISDTYTINTEYVPLDTKAEMSIKLHTDTLANKAQYGIIGQNKDKEYWVGGIYRNGFVRAEISELGNTYAVGMDTEKPIITPLHENKWIINKRISIKATDNMSGVKTYRGTIDGKYVLFSHDGKSPTYHYSFDERLKKTGKEHSLEFYVIDLCGNESFFKTKFIY